MDAAAGTLTAARAVLWGGLTLLLFVVLVPPRGTAGEGWPAVGTLTGTRRVRTDRLVIARSTGDRLGDDAGPLDSTPQESADLVYRQLRRDLINVEVSELHRLYDEHRISGTTRRRLQRSLDLEEARLADA